MILNSILPALAFVALSLSVVVPSATADVRDDLKLLKEDFEKRIAESGESQYRLFLAELENLERTLVSQRNYASAAQVKNEVELVKRRLSLLEKGIRAPIRTGKAVFLPESAELAGGVSMDESGYLTGWRSPEDYAQWKLPDLQPGGYEVIMEFSASSTEGGKFIVSEAFFRISSEIKPTDGIVVKMNFGTLKIRSGDSRLTVFVPKDNPGGLMHLKSIELIPAWQ